MLAVVLLRILHSFGERALDPVPPIVIPTIPKGIKPFSVIVMSTFFSLPVGIEAESFDLATLLNQELLLSKLVLSVALIKPAVLVVALEYVVLLSC